MRALLVVVLVLGGLYGGYWFIGARAAEQGAERVFTELAARGYVAECEALSVVGFPSRFDVTVTAPRLSDPARGIGWQAPFVQVFSLSYKPWHLIAALPNEQKLTLPGQEITIGSTRMQGSVEVSPTPSLPLKRLDGVAEGVSLRSTAGWALAAASANIAVHAQEAHVQQVALRLLDLLPDQRLTALLSAQTALPERISRMDVLADVTLAGPVALSGSVLPGVEAVALREAHLIWGPMTLRASGTLRPDDLGQAEGKIDLRIEGWREGFLAAQALGLIPQQFAVAAENVLAGLAAQSGDAAVLELPLLMQNGRMMLGPVPLGAAPLLR